MKLRERLADWISGGALSRLEREAKFHLIQATAWVIEDQEHYESLAAIEAATRNGKSGTARKINRMAREAAQ